MNKKTSNILLIIVSVLLVAAVCAQCLYWGGVFGRKEKTLPAVDEPGAAYTLSREGYRLEKAVVLSRHNIRSPLSGAGSALGTLTPHEWFSWSSGASELSLRGGVLETIMGQYFRKWLEKEGVFPENYRPEGDAVRIYANSKQRTLATAEYFAAGLLPSSNVQVEYHMEFDQMDPVFTPQLTFVTPEYAADAEAQMRGIFGNAREGLSADYELLSGIIDLKDSQAWRDGTARGFVTDDLELKLELSAEPGMSGSLKTACSVSDALVLQYYEESDELKAAFGHEIGPDEWRRIGRIKDVYGDILFTAPLIAPVVAHPLLCEIEAEMNADGRRFSFLCGHDSNIGSVLASLGVRDYSLPETIEKTPIGCKLVFARWEGSDGGEYWSADMVYQSVRQLRGVELIDTEHPPVVYPLAIPGLDAQADGLYRAEDFERLISEATAEYGRIAGKYGVSVMPEENMETGEFEAVYVGVDDYGAAGTNRDNMNNFTYCFEVGGRKMSFGIMNGTTDANGNYDYPIQNKLKEGYSYFVKAGNGTITSVREKPDVGLPAVDPPVTGRPGELTVKNLLKTALAPAGTTLYIYGGGWNWQDDGSAPQTRTLGVSPDWRRFFLENDADFTYKEKDGDAAKADPANSYYPYGGYNEYYYAGLDCSGYLGWVLYNTFETESGKEGYVGGSTGFAKRLAAKGWGEWTQDVKAPAADNGYSMLPGDIMSINGHVWMSLGTCRDGSVVIVHSTPSVSRTGQPGGGVQLSAIGTGTGCEAYVLADKYMSEYYPEWYGRYPVKLCDPAVYFSFTGENAGRFTWSTGGGQTGSSEGSGGGLADPDNIRGMTPAEVLKALF